MKLVIPQLPVVTRELIELAQRKSTYRLRCFGVGIPLFVSIIYLTGIQAQAESALDLIGSGQMLHMLLYITLLCVLYLLAPAMCCSAITVEKEKQTLGLLLISKLTPFSLVLEKICSRMIPLLSLVIGSSPLFGVAFLLGGVTVGDTVTAIVCLIYVTLQVTIIAVSASALMKSSIGAFWVTYLTLIVMYFGAPLLAEGGMLPLSGPSSMQDDWLFLFPPYQADLLGDQVAFGMTLNTNFDLLWLTVPSALLTVSFFVIGWVAVLKMSDTGGLTFNGLLKQVQPTLWLKQVLRFIRHETQTRGTYPSTAISDLSPHNGEDLDTDVTSVPHRKGDYIWSNFEAAYRPIFWRERLAMPLLRKKILFCVLTIFGLLFFVVWANSTSSDQSEEAAAFVLVSFIAALLMMVSLATRIFTRERDQQTLESLLVLPISNREILNEKMAPLNLAVWWLVSPMMLVTCLSICLSQTYTHRDSDAIFFICIFSHGVLYLHLVKWIAVYFGLRMKTNMKAMVASLGTIMLLCLGLIAITVTTVLSFNGSLDDGLFWFYSSPVIVPMLGAFRDLSELYERNIMPDFGLLVIAFNLSLYFAVLLAVKLFTLRKIPELLGRRDQGGVFSLFGEAHLSPLGAVNLAQKKI